MFETVEETLFDTMQKIAEAHCVNQGIPINRQFFDGELEQSQKLLNNGLSQEEIMGHLSPEEQVALDSLNARTLMPFRVTVTADGLSEAFDVLAPDACSANIMAMEMLFGDFTAARPKALKIKVEAINGCELRVAA